MLLWSHMDINIYIHKPKLKWSLVNQKSLYSGVHIPSPEILVSDDIYVNM